MLHAMIMAGGKGTRFWPLSRLKRPKQFLSIVDERTLMDATLDRISTLVEKEATWILGNVAQAEALQSLSSRVLESRILQEPFGKNTAACMAWGAFEVLKEDPEAICVMLSADAWIQPADAFEQTIRAAVKHVEETSQVTIIGIPPTRPHIGYGYIKTATLPINVLEPVQVESFEEKPDLQTAMSYLESGNYTWNAGIFVFKAANFLASLHTHMPEHYVAVKAFTDAGLRAPADIDPYYAKLEPISIDYGLMEKLGPELALVHATFKWDDIGSWSALEAHLPQDSAGNAYKGKLLAQDSSGNIVFSSNPDKVMALSSVNNMVVVDTEDALLVIPKSDDQAIKAVYEQLDTRFQ